MFSPFRRISGYGAQHLRGVRSCGSVAVFVALCVFAPSLFARELRVCADPDNMPYSNRAQQGFDNKIAAALANEMHARLVYEWARYRGRGFIGSHMRPGHCDLLLGVPSGFRPVLTTEPYYRSSYVFVTRRDRKLDISSFDDPKLRNMKIGVQVLDEDYAPPARALARRGLVQNIVGFESFGDDAPKIVDAVAKGKVDVAVVWGPLAGYYARKHGSAVNLTEVSPPDDGPGLPFVFPITVGVRKSAPELRSEVAAALERIRPQVERILATYGIPHQSMLNAQTSASLKRGGTR